MLVDVTSRSQESASLCPNLDLYSEEAYRFRVGQLKKTGEYERRISLDMGVVTDPQLVPGFHKRSQVIVEQQIRSSISESDCHDYLADKMAKSLTRQIVRSLFFATNHGLDQDQSLRFMGISYELDKLKSRDTIGNLSELVSQAILLHRPVELLHIKSIRFTYPMGNRLQVLEDTNSVTQPSADNGYRTYPGEAVIFQRLSSVAEIFNKHGVDVSLSLIVSDHDLQYCFPPQQQIVPHQDVVDASLSVERYINFLRSQYPKFKNIYTLTEYLHLAHANESYQQLFSMLVFQGQGGGGQHVSEKILEMRVDGQFEHYKEMFPGYTRELARYTAIRQIANVMALSAVFNTFPSTPLLTIDSRGFEDQLIGSYNPSSVVKLFTKLKDPIIKC